jgi:hypothetical protein
MPTKSTDPVGCVPSSASVQKALEDARRRVSTLEFLLDISQGIECRMRGLATEMPACVQQQTAELIAK